ncbi:MAG: FAD-dependent oxidoreductase [Bacteroidetes bacterium]|nr:MAG: FAD-dependent oxidoreductase [Bacteroidota bacterium]
MDHYDVAVCGGGLAGLTLAYQLSRELPNLSVVVIEKAMRPLPDAAHKVGESTVEIGAHYLSEVLGLREYLNENQYPKLGLRYFYGDGTGAFEDRPELGASTFSPVPTYQLDRGSLENDLRKFVVDAGVKLEEGASIAEISISESENPHTIQFAKGDETNTITAQWVVDAMGRRRFLQRKFNLQRDNGHAASSAWFRLEGKISVNDLVPKSNKAWHKRNLEDRYYSTNHLMGQGYWVWLIPLSSGNTSIGIVVDENIHPFESYATSHEKALEWLMKHETVLAKHIENKPPLDFRKIKKYSYSSAQVFSKNRWTCVGEAGVFSDPFYSPGSDLIAITNTFTLNLIKADFDGNLKEENVDLLNDTLLKVLYQDQISYFRESYAIFGNTHVSSAKFLWDTTYYWSLYAHTFKNGLFKDFEFIKEYAEILKKFSKLNRSVQQLFRVWAREVKSNNQYTFCDLSRKHFFIKSAIGLLTCQDQKRFSANLLVKYDEFEKMANALFVYAQNQTDLNGIEEYSEYDQDLIASESLLKKYHKDKLQKEMSFFKEFFEPLTSTERFKIVFINYVSTIWKGSYLYFVRGTFIKFFVNKKQKVGLSGVLRFIYAD